MAFQSIMTAPVAAASEISGLLAAVPAEFRPARLIFLVCWVYLCMYSVQRIEFGNLVSKKHKPVANAFALLIGPFILFTIHVVEITKGIQDGRIQLADVLTLNIFKKSAVPRKPQKMIELLDSSGRSFAEIYGTDSQGVDRETLDHTEQIILEGLEQHASDILIDPKTSGIDTVRYRVDGFLRLAEEIEHTRCSAIVNSIKAIAGMDIAERRRPQDGTFIAQTSDGRAQFRVASAGVLGGEKLSIRVLDQSVGMLRLDDLHMTKKHHQIVSNSVKQPSGMILVCGPTGSGKTTSLYAMLSTIDFDSHNVITVEDPVEHVLPNASQIEVNRKADITFANTLRSILRQDPDVIVVGEIRDAETAAMALQASQTGHLVLATIHSSSNAATLVRLMDLGIKPLLIGSALSLVISQRLVRRLCDNCKKPANLPPDKVKQFQQKGIDARNIMKPVGCKRCGNTGFSGRMAIMDVMTIDENVRSQIVNSTLDLGAFKKKGDTRGKNILRQQGLRLVVSGQTTMDEVKRVTSRIG
ncbi:Type II traffic warden ATPase [Anaerohalosphaera lusitana]|uniref:Type II traffic warden ATPase n=1 Tax=Anaerohalosphaera lusitana TaxID=1936003 RepID=A0A1U9NJS6_9BACT|nr:GspE/PulE family protein [Anaerohalosphaera lusitana]AQT68193.1 Type II traffic warden ATPase [Anaerohalosphaera lusitana]